MHKILLGLALIAILAPLPARAQSVRVDGLWPGTTLAASTTVTFAVSTTGFASPSVGVSDSFTGAKRTNGVFANGFFSWTPTVYDAGWHTLTVSASDQLGRSASTTLTLLVTSNRAILSELSPADGRVALGSPLTFLVEAPGFISPTYYLFDSAQFTSATHKNFDANGKFSWTPRRDDLGSHRFVVHVKDQYGHDYRLIQDITVVETLATTTPVAAATSSPAAAPAVITTPPTISPPPTNASAIPAADSPQPQATSFRFTAYLTLGSRGNAVSELQKRLATLGYFSGEATGYFGRVTTAAVKKFQAARQIEQTGSVGPLTRAALNAP